MAAAPFALFGLCGRFMIAMFNNMINIVSPDDDIVHTR